MKKIISLLLILTLLIPSGCMAEASTKTIASEEKSEEVLRLKKLFNIGDYKNFDFSSYTNENKKVLSYQWSDTGSSLNIETDSEGNILSYSKYEDSENTSGINLKDKKEIQKKADDFIKKIAPDVSTTYRPEDVSIYLGSKSADVTYYRYVNDIKVRSDYISVSVNLSNGEIERFYTTENFTDFPDSKFPDPSKAIAKEEAFNKIFHENPMYLTYYMNPSFYNKTPSYFPAYTQLKKNDLLDAISGDFIDFNEDIIAYKKEEEAKDAAAAEGEGGISLSEVEMSELNTVKGLKTLDEVKKYLSDNFDLQKYELKSTSLNKYSEDKYAYAFYYQNKKSSINIAVDAENLELINYNNYFDGSGKKANLSSEKAIKAADEFIKKYNSSKDIDKTNPIVSSSPYSTQVTYYRQKDNHYIVKNGIEISIDNKTGKVTEYVLSLDDLEFKPIGDVISEQEAKKIAMDNISLSYAYVNNEVRLVYDFDYDLIIRANDGKLVGSGGKVFGESDIVYEDLDKSSYKDELEYLTSLGIGLPKSSKVSDPVTVMDYVYLLSLIESPMVYEKDFIASHLDYWIFEDLNDDDIEKSLTRKDAVKWIMNSMNYKGIKDLKDVFDSSIFTDYKSIPKDYRAYYALAKAYSIYDFKDASPNKTLTLEEALHLIYNYVNAR